MPKLKESTEFRSNPPSLSAHPLSTHPGNVCSRQILVLWAETKKRSEIEKNKNLVFALEEEEAGSAVRN